MMTTPTSTTTPIPPERPKPVLKTWKPTTAGILTIVAGASEVLGGIIVTVLGVLGSAGYSNNVPKAGSTATFPTVILLVIGLALIVIGIVAVIGGVSALHRKRWGFALAGAILALGSLILGILAIVFVAMGKKEFS